MSTIFSRYQQSRIAKLTLDDGTPVELYEFQDTTIPVPTGAIQHKVMPTEDMFTLAFDYLGDENLWHRIAEINPHVFYPLDIKVGDIIWIPSKGRATLGRAGV